ncbi:MAG: hypothetical protein ACI9OH_001312 [Oleispira sp.]|jgi:hypothetical protein
MKNHNSLEKRQLPRLLCDDNFSFCRLNYSDDSYILQSINYHHQGIGLFCSDRLPIDEKCTINFFYKNDSANIEISELPCIVLRRHETDAGNQYGIEFRLDNIKPEMLAQLMKVEHYLLLQQNDSDDRYGIFSL